MAMQLTGDDRELLQNYVNGCTICNQQASLSCSRCHRRFCDRPDCQERHQEFHASENQTIETLKKKNMSYASLAASNRPVQTISPSSPKDNSAVDAVPSDLSPPSCQNSPVPSSTEVENSPPSTECSAARELFLAAQSDPFHHSLLPVRPVGITNISATCYMASALQVLLATDVLRQFFADGRYTAHINSDNIFGSGGRICDAFAKICNSMNNIRLRKQHSNKPFSIGPQSLVEFFQEYRALNCLYHSPAEQHDSQEFFSDLLDRLHEDLNVAPMENGRKKCVELIKKKKNETDMACSIRFKGLLNSRDHSFIHDLFGGMFKANVTCGSCNYSTCTFERFCLLTLNLPTTLVKQYRVVVFPLPRGSPPHILHCGLPHGAKVSDLAEKAAKALRTDKDKIILVHKRDSSYLVMDGKEQSESFYERHREQPGDVNNIPSVIYAYEDALANRMRARLTEQDTTFLPNGTRESGYSPCYQYTTTNDLTWNQRTENEGEWRDLGTYTVIVDLDKQSIAKTPNPLRLVVYPLVFRVPYHATMGNVRMVLIHALQTMAKHWGWTQKTPVTEDGDLPPPSLKMNDSMNQYAQWFSVLPKLVGTPIVEATATKLSDVHNKVQEIWSPHLRKDSRWRASLYQDVANDYQIGCDILRYRKMDQYTRDNDDVKGANTEDTHRGHIEQQMCEALDLTTAGQQKVFTSSGDRLHPHKLGDQCWFLIAAENNLAHLTYQYTDEPGSTSHLEASYEIRSCTTKDSEASPESILDEHPTAYKQTYPNIAHMSHDDFLTRFLPVHEKYNHVKDLVKSDKLLRGTIKSDDAAVFLESLPFYKCHISHILDKDDIRHLSEDGIGLTKYMSPEQISTHSSLSNHDYAFMKNEAGHMIESMAAPIWNQRKLLSINPRCLAVPSELQGIADVEIDKLLLSDKRPEYLFMSDAWKCDACHVQESSTLNHSIWNTGEYVFINLKRFSFLSGSGNSRKNKAPFVFPESGTIDLADLIEDPSQEETVFEIFGAIIHQGSLEAGHYISLIKGNPEKNNGLWYRIDDELVSAITNEQARNIMRDSYIVALRKIKYQPQYSALPEKDDDEDKSENGPCAEPNNSQLATQSGAEGNQEMQGSNSDDYVI